MSQTTVIATQPQEIAGLPRQLAAFPVYRVTERAGGATKHTLVRVHIRPAVEPTAEQWQAALNQIPDSTRAWLLRERSRKATSIVNRLKDHTMQLTYQWCLDGLISFEAEPPARLGAEHGRLVQWKLADDVSAYVERDKQDRIMQRETMHDEARQLIAALADHPITDLLADPDGHDLSTLGHILTVSRSLLTPDSTIHQVTNSGLLHRLTRGHQLVHLLARGEHRDYRPDNELARGGQAVVFRATHKVTRVPVAIKRLKARNDDSVARMRLEIEATTRFGAHRNIVPVLDVSPDGDWFAMPIAEATAKDQATQLRDPDQLRLLVEAIIDGLREPHRAGWIHRDLKPENLLMVNGHWAIADWGIGRRPRGLTTTPGRTHTGSLYGTEGYAAPESSRNAHDVGPQADIYSIGQIIGAVFTGRQPLPNIPLLPDGTRWIEIVKAATHFDPAYRPATVDELLDLLERVW
ncbi:serine/threonine-protein kinase [Actinoplanes sp. NPDC049316]|uniref:serine/threonine-protein kinase n=1 Tax=Actinoplanes sp. NPDC049316 TaxID=3154727 RepID=UPI003445EEC0